MKLTLQRLVVLVITGVFLMFTTPQAATAQDALADLPEPGVSEQQVQDYGRAGYPRVRIYLWGNGQAGVWTVEEGTDLLEFLSVAARADFNESSETRTKNILRIYRQGQLDEDPVFKTKMEKLFSRQIEFPRLQNGDVLVVETIQRRRYLTFQSISRVVGTVSSVLSLTFLLTRD